MKVDAPYVVILISNQTIQYTKRKLLLEKGLVGKLQKECKGYFVFLDCMSACRAMQSMLTMMNTMLMKAVHQTIRIHDDVRKAGSLLLLRFGVLLVLKLDVRRLGRNFHF